MLNIPQIKRLELRIKHPFRQQSFELSHEFVAAILEEHLFYAQLYTQMVEHEVRQMEFVAKTRL